jgi:hypothetical protein
LVGSKRSSAFGISGFKALLVVRALRGVAIFRLGVAILLGDADRVDLVRVERPDGGGSTAGAALSRSNLGGIEMWVFNLSLLPFSIGAGSSNASIQCRIEYSSDRASATQEFALAAQSHQARSRIGLFSYLLLAQSTHFQPPRRSLLRGMSFGTFARLLPRTEMPTETQP